MKADAIMTDDILDDDDLGPPDRPDFRRIGRGIPYVMGTDGKRQRYSRSSNSGKLLDDESNLTDWKLRTQLVGAAQRPELLALVSTLDPKGDKKQIRDIAEQCLVAGKGQERQIKGTAIHAMFDHLDRGDNWEPAPQYLAVCNAYLACLEAYGLVPIDVEVHCINDEYRLAGTLDRRYRVMRSLLSPTGRIIPIGSVIVGDTKTGTTLEYASGSYATQLAAYVDSMRYDVETDERSLFDPPNYQDWAVIMHADAELGTCEAYWVDIEAGRQGLQLASTVRQWRNRTDLLMPAQAPTVPVPSSPDARESQNDLNVAPPVEPAPEMPADVPQVPVDAATLAQWHQWLRLRVLAIVGHSGAAGKALQLAWPMDTPGLKQDGHSADQLEAIERACDRVEADYSVPFGSPKPASLKPQEGPHWSDRWGHPSQQDRTPMDQVAVQSMAISNHPRSELLRQWVQFAIDGGLDSTIDHYALSNALYEFANMDPTEWPDDDLTIMLDGSLRAIGYMNGVQELGRFQPSHAPYLMSAAFAIAAGNAMLLYDENEKPVVRNVIRN